MGDRLNELALAARFNISRGPIREACRSLAQAGLLEIQINRGFFVRKLAQKEVVDLYDLRAGLMRLAGELLAKNITPDQLAQIKVMVDSMDEAQRAGDAERFRELNRDFHAALVEATDNRRLVEMYQGLVKEIQLFRRRGLVSASAMELSNREHRTIVEAIVAQDAARTAAAMEQHILQGKARFLAAARASIYD
jgi:DNA-binding GntR family transcriptional regulator